MTLLRRRPLLIAGIVVALLVVLVFGAQAAWRLGRRLMGPPPPPRQTDVSLIADWMSVPYVGRAYRVPEPELYRALGLEPEGRGRREPLREIAQETGRSSDEVLAVVRETVSTWQEAHPGPPTPIGAPSPPLPVPKTKDDGQDGPRPPP